MIPDTTRRSTPSFRPDEATELKMLEQQRVIQEKVQKIIDATKDDPNYQNQPKSYVKAWKLNVQHLTWDDPDVRALHYFQEKISDHEMKESADKWIKKVENSWAYQRNPQAYIEAWIKRRGASEEYRRPEDIVLDHFRPILTHQDKMPKDIGQQNQNGCVIA